MRLVEDLVKSHVEILNTIDGLSDEELNRSGTIGKWSARDTILHIAMWEGEVLKALAIWRTGHDVDWSYAKDYLKFNDFWHQSLSHLSSNQVQRLFNLTHKALVDDIKSISSEVWQRRGEPIWIRDVTINHNIEHINKLMNYKKSLGH